MPMEEYLYKSGGQFTSSRQGKDDLPVTDMAIKERYYVDVTLHNELSVTGSGTAFEIGGFSTLNLKITGANTSRTVIFEVMGTDGEYEPLAGVKAGDFEFYNTTTEKGVSFQFDVRGFVKFRARVTTLAGGPISIKGRAVA
jgi:hypothetical protein